MGNFEEEYAKLLGIEGDYSDDKVDKGGKTKLGITETVARANGYMGPMDQLPASEARRITKSRYWDLLRLDQVEDKDIAGELFDSAFNCGQATVTIWLQKILRGMSYSKPWDPPTVDGVMGPVTIYILNTLCKMGYSRTIFNHLNSRQDVHYMDYINYDMEQGKYHDGWVNNRVRFKTS